MRVVTPRRLKEFGEVHPAARVPLLHWYGMVKEAKWDSLTDVRADFRTVDYVGNNRYVFDIKGNAYRLIVIIIFASRKVYIRFIGTHAAYDKVDAKTIQSMTQEQYEVASTRMEELLRSMADQQPLSSAQQAELDHVSDLVADYEEQHYPFEPTTLREAIELRMFQRKLRQKDLAALLGTSPSRISEILNGKRELNLAIAKALHQKLNIDADFILTAP